jgi:hypothetical protein
MTTAVQRAAPDTAFRSHSAAQRRHANNRDWARLLWCTECGKRDGFRRDRGAARTRSIGRELISSRPVKTCYSAVLEIGLNRSPCRSMPFGMAAEASTTWAVQTMFTLVPPTRTDPWFTTPVFRIRSSA